MSIAPKLATKKKKKKKKSVRGVRHKLSDPNIIVIVVFILKKNFEIK